MSGSALAALAATTLWAGANDGGGAQEVQARAYLNAPQVGVGRQFVLNVEVAGTQQLEGEPELPAMDDFARYLGAGTSTSMQIVNGRTSVSLTYQYRFLATQEGDFEIGVVRVPVGGQVLETEPLTLVVSDAPPSTTGAGPGARPGAGARSGAGARPGAGTGTDDPGASLAPDDLFVEGVVSKTRAFENEPVTVEYRLFTLVNVESYSITDLPLATGFLTEELEQPDSPTVERLIRNGREYVSAVIRRVVLFPTGPGRKTLDPLGLEAQVRVRNRSFDPFGDLFGRGLLDSRVPVAVASRPIEIEVLPLPSSGRPDSFGGHVGELVVSTSVDRDAVQANEAVTFRVEMEGTGNLRALSPPEIDFPAEFEVFPPEASARIAPGGGSLQGVRSFEYVLVPRVPGRLTLPPVEASSFDPGSRTYRATRAGSIELVVEGGASAAEGEGAVPSAVERVREEIRFIHAGPVRFAPVGRRLVATPGFWAVLLLPAAAVAGAGAYRRRRDRLEGDVAYARTRRAARRAKKRLATAKGMASGDPRAFYAEVAGALQGFLADKLNVSAASLVREEVARSAAARGVSAGTLERLFACLDHCDRQRFAPTGAERESPEAELERAASLMAEFDRELSR